MSDVRDELYDTIKPLWNAGVGLEPAIEAILERFDVTPKPVVTERDMGGMMAYALLNCRSTNVEIAGVHFDEPGRMLLNQLAEAGLMIVRVPDAS